MRSVWDGEQVPKKYQVFVSSTYTDLREERHRVIQTLMEMDCIPSGMELFPAADEEQWAFIRKVIDDCDYYLLLVGGRYGSLSPDGLSFTEKEFDYAVERDIRIVALLHEQPEEISLAKSEATPELRQRLDDFRSKVRTGRLVRTWRKSEDLPGLVATSLSKTITTYPALGWVRSNEAGDPSILAELNELRKERDRLQGLVKGLQTINPAAPSFALAGLDETVSLRGTYWFASAGRSEWQTKIKWRELFALIAPLLIGHPIDSSVQDFLAKHFAEQKHPLASSPAINTQDYFTIRTHLSALKLVSVDYTSTTSGGAGLFWMLTKSGQSLLIESRAVRSSQ
jgi:hypothetical protein